MSIRRLPKAQGMLIRCDGTDETDCAEKVFTANTWAAANRAWFAKDGWGRGLRSISKSRDLCPYHLKLERFLRYQYQWRRAVERAAKDEKLKAKFSPNPTPKKPRKKKASATTSTPSAASDPVAATL